MLELPHDLQLDSSLVAEITKLQEDANSLTKSTYAALLGLGCSLLDLGLVILFLTLPHPIGVSDQDSWQVPVFSLTFLFVLLGLVYAISGESTTLVEEFISAAHERHLAWERLLSDRLLTMNAQMEGQAVKELSNKIKNERAKEWEVLVHHDTTSNRANWVVEFILFFLYALFPAFIAFKMLGIDVAKALAIISAFKSLPGILISILQTAQSFSEGAVQLRQYSDIFNLETSAFHRMQLLKQRFDFLKERRLAKKGINILAWKGLKYETMPGGWIKKEPFAKSPQKPSSFSSSILSKGTAKVVPKNDGASKISVATKTATSFKGNYATTVTTTITTTQNFVERRFLRDCLLDLHHNDQEVELGGVIAVVFPEAVPFKASMGLLRVIGGVTPPTEGVMFLPPHARVLAVPDVPALIPGTLMDNLRYACGQESAERFEEVPSDAAIVELCQAVGLHSQLVAMVVDSSEQTSSSFAGNEERLEDGFSLEEKQHLVLPEAPLELLGTGGELDDFDADLVMLVQMLTCLPDVLVLLNVSRLCKATETCVRINCALQAFCRVETATDLKYLPAATAVLIHRIAADAKSKTKTSAREESLRQKYKKQLEGAESEQFCAALASAADCCEEFLPEKEEGGKGKEVMKFLERKPSRTVVWPSYSTSAELLKKLGIPKEKTMQYDDSDGNTHLDYRRSSSAPGRHYFGDVLKQVRNAVHLKNIRSEDGTQGGEATRQRQLPPLLLRKAL